MVDIFSKKIQSFKAGLRKTSEVLSSGISRILSSGEDQAGVTEELEELLIAADIGVETAGQIVERVKAAGPTGGAEGVRAAIKQEIIEMLTSAEPRPQSFAAKPHVVLVVGVNGTGKTTTIAKLAKRYQADGRTVILAAADTYRAAAIEQLEIWAKRIGSTVVKHKPGADAASVAYDACSAAKARGADVVIIDTAGRLQTKANLMDEVAKIGRVVGKVVEGAPHEVLLVLDATTGQNAISQARAFSKACGVTGIVIAKLDGTAKGGIVVAIAKDLGIPIDFVGTGEAIEDLETFDAAAFAEGLLG
ncbi:MAG TPA: signal recognition particle-docking protein FtsY [bacterium]|nr:signal recognition particle-docking protein FtsY [bacterium]